jgi:CheY-like chemotaxis protein
VRRHDGFIDVESVPGRGTTFHIYLPATDREAVSEAPREAATGAMGGRVLLMDDDEMILEVGSRMLRLYGYEVELSRDGAEAMARYREAMERGTRFDAAILDLTVPGGMGGRETARALRKLDPDGFLIASSGYSTDPVMADHRTYGFDAVVAKPYGPEDLERALKPALLR